LTVTNNKIIIKIQIRS